MIKRYIKRPVKIEAIQYDGTNESFDEIYNWMKHNNGYCYYTLTDKNEGAMFIRTLEGNMTAIPTDFIIRGIKGEFYPCKEDIFLASYEEEI